MPSKLDSWRILAKSKDDTEVALESDHGFDELVVGEWFHIEKMDKTLWWVRIGDARVMVDVRLPHPKVDVTRGDYGPVVGDGGSKGDK